MPTYEYKCLDCGRSFDFFQSMRDDPLETCEECGGRLKRLIGAGAGIIFKGNGFYCTDYRSEAYRKAAKSEKEGASKDGPAGGSEKKDTGKPATTDKGSSKPTEATKP